jgi:hypothetical protein
MGLRLFLVLAIVGATLPADADAARPPVAGSVHTSNLCWDPDVEFPVPCEDDDD